MKTLSSLTPLACFALSTLSGLAADLPAGKLVLADYMPHHRTRPSGGSLDTWRRDGNALQSAASVKRRVSNADLIGPDGRNQIAAMVYPITGMQSEEDEDYIEYQVLQAKVARIDGFMVEWSGPGKASSLRLRDTAARFGFFVGANWCVTQTRDWAAVPTLGAAATPDQLLAFGYDYASKLRKEFYEGPTAPRLNGRPLVLLFGGGYLTASELPGLRKAWGDGPSPLLARNILSLPDANAMGVMKQGVQLLDGFYPWSGSGVPDLVSKDPELAPLMAAHTHDAYYLCENIVAYRERWIGYTKAFSNKGLPLRIGCVMPGMDNRPCGGWGGKLAYIARKDGETHRRQWALYQKERNNLDFVFVATWNDFTEDTVVQPTLERGYKDLAIVEAGASGFKGVPSDPSGLALPKRLFDLRKGYAQLARLGMPPGESKARLDLLAQLIAKRDFARAAAGLGAEEVRIKPILASVVSEVPVTCVLLDKTAEKDSTATAPVWLNLSSALASAVRTRRCDTEMTWEFLDTDSTSYKIYTNSSGTAPKDTIAEITGTGSGQWKSAKIRVYDENCFFVSSPGTATIKVVGNVKFRNMVVSAVAKSLPPEAMR